MFLDRLISLRYGFKEWTEEFYEAFAGGERGTISGQRVSPDKALSLSAYFAAIRAIAEDVAKLPFILYERQKPRGKKRRPEHPVYTLIHDQPNPQTAAMPFWETMLHHAMGWGNGMAEIQRERGGMPVAMWGLDPTMVRVYRDDSTDDIWYELRFGKGKSRQLRQVDVFHLHGMGFDGITGYSIAQKARETIGAAIAARKHGSALFGHGSRPGGLLSFPGPVKDKPAARKAWEEGFAGEDNWHRTAVLDMGATYTPIGIPNKDAQWIEAQNFSVEEIARWFRIPPPILQHLVYGTYANVEHLDIAYVKYTLTAWAKRLWQEVWRKLIPSTERKKLFAEHLFEELLRGDTLTRYQAHAVARQWGWASADDIRELENQNPLPGEQGTIYMVPSNMMPAEKMLEPDEPEPPPMLPQQEEQPEEEEKQPEEGERFEMMVRAHVPALRSVYGNILRVEQDKIRRHIKRRDFAQWYLKFRNGHVAHTEAMLCSPIQTLILSSRPAAIGVNAKQLAQTHARGMAQRHVNRITDRTRLRVDDVNEWAAFEVERELPGLVELVRKCALN